jgi:hypothetical protein
LSPTRPAQASTRLSIVVPAGPDAKQRAGPFGKGEKKGKEKRKKEDIDKIKRYRDRDRD